MSALNFAGNPGKAEVREITNQAEWLAWRKHDYTASRIGVLFECHPYIRSLEAVLAEMRGQSVKGDNEYMRAGRWLQAAFPEALKDVRPDWVVVPATTYHRLPELRLACTPDFWVTDPVKGDGVLETKTFAEREWERHHSRPPLGYLLQTLCQMMVCDAAWGALAVMIKSATLPLHIFEVPRHPFAESKVLEAVARFWKRVDAGEFPETTAPDELEAMLDDGTYKDFSSVNHLPNELEEYEKLKAEISEAMQQLKFETSQAQERIKQIEYDLKNRLGNASRAWLPGWEITWYKQHRKATDFRVFRVRRRSNEDDNG